jgi:23S rRNA (pseudouridine1915-N3)-methyltransferase
MLNVTVICVGKMKERFYIDAAAEYQKRLKGYCKLELIELPEEKLPQAPTLGQIQGALEKEYEAIAAKLPKSGRVVAMCVEGVPMSSTELSQTLGGWMVAGVSDVTFVVGGSYGLSPRVKKRADLRLSMSEMTFPHHLARVMLLEQIYRAFKIQEGSGYHK